MMLTLLRIDFLTLKPQRLRCDNLHQGLLQHQCFVEPAGHQPLIAAQQHIHGADQFARLYFFTCGKAL